MTDELAVPKWEHWTGFVWANAAEQAAFLRQRWPDWSAPKFAPQALMPTLDRLGAQGWELVSLDPVVVGKNEDVMVHYAVAGNVTWTNAYFCVMKRRVRSIPDRYGRVPPDNAQDE